MNRYRAGGDVHWIQAKKAWGDNDSWREADVRGVVGDVITVALAGDETLTHYESVRAGRLARSGHETVWVSARWHILAFPDEKGNVIGLQPLGVEPDSVFDRAGSERLCFLSIKEVEPVEYVYATVTGADGNDYFYVLPRPEAEDVADIMRIMRSCSTWGEVRRASSFERYQEILGVAGYGSLDEYVEHVFTGRPIPGALEAAARKWEETNWVSGIPADDDPFDPMEIDSYSCGDWPPFFESLADQCLPDNLIDLFGRRDETSINGTFATIPVENGPKAVSELQRLGHRCVEEFDLFQNSVVRW